MTDTFDELRIIAKDAAGLSSTDRGIIRNAADEMEQVYRALSKTQSDLIETQRHEIAVGERLLAAMKREHELLAELSRRHPPFEFPAVSPGGIKVTWK